MAHKASPWVLYDKIENRFEKISSEAESLPAANKTHEALCKLTKSFTTYAFSIEVWTEMCLVTGW